MTEKEKSHLAFQEILQLHKGILFKVVRTYCQNESDRQDLIQEIMLQMWQSFHKYDHTFKITTWMYRIAINVAISFYRKNTVRQIHTVVLNEIIAPIQEDEMHQKEDQLNLLDQFIGELRELDKALILLYLEDKSHLEIADILGISVGNVGTKVARIKDKLKQRFSQQKSN